MGHILHDWDLAQKRMLLAKAFDALPKDGALVVYEALIDDDRRENAFGLLMSLNMLLATKGGFDFTGADCRGGWARQDFRKQAWSRSRAQTPWLWRSNRAARAHAIGLQGN